MKKDNKKTVYVTLLLSLVLALLIFTFSACGGKKPTDEDAAPNSETQSTEAEAQEEDTQDAAAPEEEVDDETTEEAETAAPDLVDIDALKAIEEKDTFEVKVTKKELLRDYYTGFTVDGHDAFVMTISNGTTGDISEVTIYTVGYDENNAAKKLQKNISVASIGGYPYISSLVTSEKTVIAGGASEELAFQFKADEIAGVRVIVASYKTADGTKVENPLVQEWIKSVIAGKTNVLD